MKPMSDWGLSDAEQSALDGKLFGETLEILDAPPEDWKHFIIAVPPDFYEILLNTIEGYKILRETDKVFPAIEAIIMEARNSLPNAVIDMTSSSVEEIG